MPIQEGFQEAVVQGSESRTCHPRCAPQRDFTWMPGAPPNPWPACWGTLTGLGSASAPPVPRQRAPEHFRKVAMAGPAAETWGSGNDHVCPGHAVRLGTQAGALREPGPYPGARRHPPQAPGGVSGEKKRPSGSCHYGTERQTERRALRESEFLAISWPTWPSPLTFWSLSYFIWETGTATSSLIIIQNCCED